MSNGFAAKVALDKKMKRESAASYRMARDLKRKAERDGSVTKKERRERPATAAKREREFLYGKKNRPEWGVSDCCHMLMSASGVCSGCGETPWYVEAMREMEVCDMSQTDFERTSSMLKAAGIA